MWPLSLLTLLIVLFKNEAGAAMDSDDSFTRFDSLYKKYGALYGVPWKWIKAISIVESNQGQAVSVANGIADPHNVPDSASSDGKSWGVMQTTLPTAREMMGVIVTEPWLNVPENSIRTGSAYLGKLVRIFGLDPEKVSRAYNGGPGYAKTRLGPGLTLVYWKKFQTALALVESRQPGV